MDELVFKGNAGQALTSSLLVAEKFGKEHKHVLESIREAIKGCAENSADPMFVETTYINGQNGQEYPMFVMNEDGFSLIAMGFTGKKAFKFKLDFIAAFKAMKKQLKEQQKPLSAVQMFALQANINLEHEERLSNVEQKLEVLSKEREENTKQLLSVSVSVESVPEISLRDKIRQLVNKYSSATILVNVMFGIRFMNNFTIVTTYQLTRTIKKISEKQIWMSQNVRGIWEKYIQ